jgi:SOS response regulatory protein OraA/RecX
MTNDGQIQLEYFSNNSLPKKSSKKRYKTTKQYLLYLINYKDYSKSELLNKSIQKGYPKQEATQIIDRFEQLGLVNDQRLKARLIEKYTGKKPDQWIQNKLWTRGLNS